MSPAEHQHQAAVCVHHIQSKQDVRLPVSPGCMAAHYTNDRCMKTKCALTRTRCGPPRSQRHLEKELCSCLDTETSSIPVAACSRSRKAAKNRWFFRATHEATN